MAQTQQEAVIVAARRSPVGRRNGALSSVHPHDLLGAVQSAVLAQVDLDPAQVDLIISGCVTKVGEQAYNIARLAALASGLPDSVPGITLDAQCGSSQQAVNLAASMVAAGTADIVLASGVEAMSRVPLGTDRQNGPGRALSESYLARYEDLTVGESAERIADKWRITRADCDAWAARSQRLAGAARDAGVFTAEIVPLQVNGATVDQDEGIRDSPVAALAKLRTAFREDGALTAASSSQISDGAAAVLVMSERRAEQLGLEPMVRVIGQSIVGVDPILRLTGPIPVTEQLLGRAGLSIQDIDHFEVNEAFASVVHAWLRATGAPDDRVNPLGGAIALGHPVGATGARLITTAAHRMVAQGHDRAIVAMCCGGGLGTGTLLARP